MIKPIAFPDCNIVIAKDDNISEQYSEDNIPVYYDKEGKEGIIISAWKISFCQRIVLLFTGIVYIKEKSFHEPIPVKYLFSSYKKILDK